MLIRNAQILCVTAIVCIGCYYQAQKLRLAGEIGAAMQLITRAYLEPVNEKDLFNSAMAGMLRDLDPYSAYIPPAQYEPFQDYLRQEFEGLGVNLDGPPNVDRLTVISPLAGTPAYKAGIEPGDVIMKIDETDTEGMRVADAAELLRGPEGSSVKLTLKREGRDTPLELQIERAAVDVQSVVGNQRRADGTWDYFLPTDPKVAYMRLETFGEKTTDELKTALKEINGKAESIILDLRENAGGLLPAAVEVADLFLSSGKIITIRGRNNVEESVRVADPEVSIDASIPLIVLVNQNSASASEIVAAALRDQKRATLVGQRSFGKGTIQQVFIMDGGKSGLKLTTAKYIPPEGENIHRGPRMTEKDQWGVAPTPELTLELNPEQERQLFHRWRRQEDPRNSITSEHTNDSYEDDPQLLKAIEYLRNMPKG